MENDKFELEDAIAVVGMSCQLPKSDSIYEFWNNLRDSIDCVREFSDDEALKAGRTSDELANSNYRNRAGCLREPFSFDAPYFHIPPKEADIMDPQIRKALECAVHALEDATINYVKHSEAIGIFAGCTDSQYYLNHIHGSEELLNNVGEMKLYTGNSNTFFASTIAYRLNLRGPAVSVQSACSTGGSAIHLAVQSILSGEVDVALAGAATIDPNQHKGYLYQRGGTYSEDGFCRPFDENASGMVPSNGVAFITLCSYEHAIKEKLPVHGLIRATAVNNDGSSKAGFASPSVEGQERVIREAMAIADLTPDEISYVEAHGTGTYIGDPIEFRALANVYQDASQGHRCGLGSVKSNIGHCDSAAAIASFIKVMLSFKHNLIPKTLHCNTPHPELGIEKTPFHLVTENEQYPSGIKRAALSSFGVGGTNVHMILQEPPSVLEEKFTEPSTYLSFPLSNADEASLKASCDKLHQFLEHETASLYDVSGTLKHHRKAFQHRATFVAKSTDELKEKLRNFQSCQVSQWTSDTALLLPGQGDQYFGMAEAWFDSASVYRGAINRCCEEAAKHTDLDLKGYLLGEGTSVVSESTVLSQLALFSVSYASAQLLEHFLVVPKVLIGHSVGEIAAACITYSLTLEDAIFLVCERANAMNSVELDGAMLAVSASRDKAKKYLHSNLSLAADNAPGRIVISGARTCITALMEKLKLEGVGCSLLNASGAFHSNLMADAIPRFSAALNRVAFKTPTRPWISNLTGTAITEQQYLNPEYWVKLMLETVNFRAGLEAVDGLGLIDLSPKRTLSKLVVQNGLTSPVMNMYRQNSINITHEFLGSLFDSHLCSDWERMESTLTSHTAYNRIHLPGYSFQKQDHFLERMAPNSSDHITQVHQSDLRNAYGLIVKKHKQLSKWFYLHSWMPTEPISMIKSKAENYRGRTFFVFHSNPLVATNFIEFLIQKSAEVFAINCSQFGTQIELDEHIGSLIEAEKYPTDIVDFRTLAPSAVPNVLATTQNLIRTLVDIEHSPVANIAYVMSNAFNISGQEIDDAQTSVISGFCKSIPQDYKKFTAQIVDLGSLDTSFDAEVATVNLTDELPPNSFDQIIVHRGQTRWTRRYPKLQNYNLTNHEEVIDHLAVFVSSELVAKTLLRHLQLGNMGVSSITFFHRSSCFQMASGSYLASNGNQVNFDCLELDGDTNDLRAAIESAENKRGEINAFYHCLYDFEYLRNFVADVDTFNLYETLEQVKNHLVDLEAIFSERRNVRGVFFSSIITLLSGIGAAPIYSAYAHLAELVKKSHGKGFSWIAIDGEGWFEDEVLKGGINATGEDISSNPGMMTLEELDSVLRYALTIANSLSRIVATPMDVHSREEWVKRNILMHNYSGEKTVKTAKQSTASEYERLGEAGKDNAIEQALNEIVYELTGNTVKSSKQNLYETGWDSLVVLQAYAKIRAKLNVDIPIRSLLEVDTIEELADLINVKGFEISQSNSLPSLGSELVSSILTALRSSSLALEESK